MKTNTIEKVSTSYDFPVELAPVKTNGIIIPRKSAVYRSDTKQPIGIVSDKYEIIKHKDVIESFRKSLKSYKHTEKIQVIKNGAQLFATYTFKEIQVEVKKNDIVGLQIVVKNSYDGTNSLQIALGALRLVCTNGMIIGKQFFSYNQRHIGSSGKSIDTNILSDKVSMLTGQFKDALPFFQEMGRHTIKRSVDELYDHEKVMLPNYLLKEAQKQYGKEKTVWEYYNTLTSVISHNLKKENPQVTIDYSKRAWEVAQNELTIK